ncbi:MAG TPA: energy-coupling factor transporter ATPase [Acholeplasma sp.]|jgi:energy-coupling factor transport system ATP-binding protein|nr:energy-coupling factor transporter ATPase [Acholeplasma sp.]
MGIIEIKNLNFSYERGKKIIDNLNLSIERGSYVVILGHNGSGKSTLAKLIVGLLEAQKGEIYIDGVKLSLETIDDLRCKMGIVFQNPDSQFVGITVKDDIAFGLENRNVPYQEMKEKVMEVARIVGMENFLEKNPEELSGGEKQRVALAGVLAYDPEILILDEATSMLDPKGVKEVNQAIQQLKHKKTILAITHNLEEALYADRVIVLNQGKVVLDDIPKRAFRNEEILKEANLDILESMKLIDLVKEDQTLSNKEEIEEILWELTFKM